MKSLSHLVGVSLLITALQGHAFGGSLAIGMSQLHGGELLEVPFQATALLDSGGQRIEETLYYQPGKLREEMRVGGQDMVTIQRHDLGKLWMLMPQGFYMETPIDQPSEQTRSFELIEHERLGSESVNGMSTTRYRTVWQTDDGRFSGMSWVTDDGIAVKADLEAEQGGQAHRLRYEMTSLTRGAQPDDLFEVPDGYRKMDLSGGRGLGALFGGPGAGADSGAEAEAAEESQGPGMGERVRQGLRGLFDPN
jgi:hypothetical protein